MRIISYIGHFYALLYPLYKLVNFKLMWIEHEEQKANVALEWMIELKMEKCAWENDNLICVCLASEKCTVVVNYTIIFLNFLYISIEAFKDISWPCTFIHTLVLAFGKISFL